MKEPINVVVVIEDGNTRILTDTEYHVNVTVIHRDTTRYGSDGTVLGREAAVLASGSASPDTEQTSQAVEELDNIGAFEG